MNLTLLKSEYKKVIEDTKRKCLNILRRKIKYTLFECIYFTYYSPLRIEILNDVFLLKVHQCGKQNCELNF